MVPQVELFSFVLWENWRHQKIHFEINWPLLARLTALLCNIYSLIHNKISRTKRYFSLFLIANPSYWSEKCQLSVTFDFTLLYFYFLLFLDGMNLIFCLTNLWFTVVLFLLCHSNKVWLRFLICKWMFY